ncbi:MAG: DUF5719 family protein [Nocardioides sp.]
MDNPSARAAVVDVTVYSRRGILDVPDLRGLRIPGRSSTVVDLAATVRVGGPGRPARGLARPGGHLGARPGRPGRRGSGVLGVAAGPGWRPMAPPCW